MTGTTIGSRGGASAVEKGVRLGIERLGQYSIYPYVDIFDTTQFVQSLLEADLARAPDRAIEMMAEHLTVAVLIRREYDEPQLSDDEIASYLDAARPFFNSLWHDPP